MEKIKSELLSYVNTKQQTFNTYYLNSLRKEDYSKPISDRDNYEFKVSGENDISSVSYNQLPQSQQVQKILQKVEDHIEQYVQLQDGEIKSYSLIFTNNESEISLLGNSPVKFDPTRSDAFLYVVITDESLDSTLLETISLSLQQIVRDDFSDMSLTINSSQIRFDDESVTKPTISNLKVSTDYPEEYFTGNSKTEIIDIPFKVPNSESSTTFSVTVNRFLQTVYRQKINYPYRYSIESEYLRINPNKQAKLKYFLRIPIVGNQLGKTKPLK